MDSKKNQETSEYTGKETHSDVENKLVATSGREEGDYWV